MSNRVQRVAVIELVGGPYDGRELVLSPGPDGLPISELPIPDPADESVYSAVFDFWTVTATPVTVYRRDVFAEVRDCWIYRPVTP